MSPDTEVKFAVVVLIVAAIIVLVAAYFYSKQLEACDREGGVLVRSGINNVCVKELK